MAAQAREEWEKAMTELAQEEPELLQHFHKLSEAAGKVEWLETNKSTLSAEDHQRYQQQAKIMEEICKLFENEEEEAADKERTFECIMDLMQKVMKLQLF
ncbi:hypothetical protein GOODEAATRI_020042 [Goodea atripinnis]|uniref:Peroxisomal biogenesis factor 19 n=1 Tax=Goodea atripinnis TaxID=208336 RepID=A0ABV0Q061_9TELE